MACLHIGQIGSKYSLYQFVLKILELSKLIIIGLNGSQLGKMCEEKISIVNIHIFFVYILFVAYYISYIINRAEKKKNLVFAMTVKKDLPPRLINFFFSTYWSEKNIIKSPTQWIKIESVTTIFFKAA